MVASFIQLLMAQLSYCQRWCDDAQVVAAMALGSGISEGDVGYLAEENLGTDQDVSRTVSRLDP